MSPHLPRSDGGRTPRLAVALAVTLLALAVVVVATVTRSPDASRPDADLLSAAPDSDRHTNGTAESATRRMLAPPRPVPDASSAPSLRESIRTEGTPSYPAGAEEVFESFRAPSPADRPLASVLASALAQGLDPATFRRDGDDVLSAHGNVMELAVAYDLAKEQCTLELDVRGDHLPYLDRERLHAWIALEDGRVLSVLGGIRFDGACSEAGLHYWEEAREARFHEFELGASSVTTLAQRVETSFRPERGRHATLVYDAEDPRVTGSRSERLDAFRALALEVRSRLRALDEVRARALDEARERGDLPP